MTAPQIGPAFARVLAALDGRTVVGAGIRRAVSCPGPGHWRGDVHPSLTIEAADGKVLLHCHAGCHLDDVLGAVGLTQADLFDKPPPRKRRPMKRSAAETALAQDASMPVTERFTVMMLLRRAHNDTLEVPPWRTPRVIGLAAEVGVGKRQMQRVLAHLDCHRWLKHVPGQGRGRKSVYLLLPDGKPGTPCLSDCPHRWAVKGAGDTTLNLN